MQSTVKSQLLNTIVVELIILVNKLTRRVEKKM